METKVLHISTPTARKEHICAVCGKRIAKGEKYLNIAIKEHGKLCNRKTHIGCSDKEKKCNVRQPSKLPQTEQEFKQLVHDDTLQMLQTFSFEENMKIAFLPLIITEVAWHYVFKVLDDAAKNRIPETIKLSRGVKLLREKYVEDCRKDLDRIHMEKVEKSADQFVANCGNDFVILYYSLSNEIKAHTPEIAYIDLRVNAGIAIIMLQLLEEHNCEMDELIKNKLKKQVPKFRNPINGKLRECMEAYLSPAHFDFEGNVRLSMRIIKKKFGQIAWNIR